MSNKKIIISDACIGCNTCPLIDPETFELDSNTYKAKVKKQPESISENTNNAISSCPVTAISIIEEE